MLIGGVREPPAANCSGETLEYTVKRRPKESIIFVPLELPTIGPVSGENRPVSQCETVSLTKMPRGPAACGLQLRLWRGQFAGNHGVAEARRLVRAIAERLVGRVPAPAQPYGGSPGQSERAALGIDDLEVPFHANRSVAVNSDLGSCHSGLRKRKKRVRRLLS